MSEKLNEQIKSKTVDKMASKKPSVFGVVLPYRVMIFWLIVLAITANILTLFLPRLISGIIDSYIRGVHDLQALVIEFSLYAIGIFILTYAQSIVQTFVSEKVARDMRLKLVTKISKQGYHFIEDKNPSRLLTNITSDIDSIKMFVAQAIVSLVSSAVIIIGAAIILLTIDWKLAIVVLTIIPIIGGTFFIIFRMVRAYFIQSREVIDWLNRVINESILGSALIRVLNSESFEYKKFDEVNTRARNIGISILKLFSFMIPVITFISSMGTLAVVTLGGYYIIQGSMTLGAFAAFNSYIVILIFPILVLGFMSNIIAQADASYSRINQVLDASDENDDGVISLSLSGRIDIKNVTVIYGEKPALKDVSLSIKPNTKTAIIGPITLISAISTMVLGYV